MPCAAGPTDKAAIKRAVANFLRRLAQVFNADVKRVVLPAVLVRSLLHSDHASDSITDDVGMGDEVTIFGADFGVREKGGQGRIPSWIVNLSISGGYAYEFHLLGIRQ